MDWREERVAIVTAHQCEGSEVRHHVVHGWVADGCPLAITADYLMKGAAWRITHIPSGMAIGPRLSLDEAKLLATELADIGNWNRSAQEIVNDAPFYRAASARMSGVLKRPAPSPRPIIIPDIHGRCTVAVESPLEAA